MLNNTHRTPLRYNISDFFSSLLGRVFACLQPNEIAASPNFIGEFVRCFLPECPVRLTLVVFDAPSSYDLLALADGDRFPGSPHKRAVRISLCSSCPSLNSCGS